LDQAIQLAHSSRRVHGFDKIHRTWIDVVDEDQETWWHATVTGLYLEVLVALQYQYKHYQTCCISQNTVGETIMVTDHGDMKLSARTVGEAVKHALQFILKRNPEPMTLDVRYIVENGTTKSNPNIYGLRFGGW
jgi:hypothetical protein